MKRSIWMILIDIIVDVFFSVKYFVKTNLRVFAIVLNLILPYVMYFIGQFVYKKFDCLHIGWYILIPIGFTIVIYLLKSIANKVGKGVTIPAPNERFTKVDDDGEVTVEVNRTPELLLYMADLEDWLERKGLL